MLPVWGEIAAFCAAIAPRLVRPADAPDQDGLKFEVRHGATCKCQDPAD